MAEETTELTAVVGTVGDNGIQLIFDGTTAQSEKLYKCNTSIKFTAGDRVKVVKEAGTYLVEYVIGSPLADYPFPSGGTDGQYLVKDGSDDYAVKWVTPSAIEGLLPTGGTAGQYLQKNSATDYDAVWNDVTVSKLVYSSTAYVNLVSTALENRGSITLGSYTFPFSGLYTNGEIRLGTSSLGNNKLGFFGTAPVTRQVVSSSATVATLITALKAYGLII